MQNSYVTLHRTLDTTISNLESQLTPNQSLITDLKKKKLQLKEHIALGIPLPKGAHTKLASMLQSHKVNAKMKRKQRKIAKHAYDEELKRRLQSLSTQIMYKAYNWMIGITVLSWVAILVIMVKYAGQ